MAFLRKTIIGLDISDYSMEALQITKQGEVLAYGRIVLPPGVVENGLILDQKKLIDKIKQLLSRTKPRPLAGKIKAVLSLPESQVFLGRPSMIPWQKTEIYQVPLAGRQACSPKKVVDDLINVLKKAGLEISALEMEPLSLARSLITPDLFKAKTAVMIIDLGARTINWSIFESENNLVLTGVISLGGGHFTKAIARQLKISEDEAEEQKKSFGFSQQKDNKVLSVLQAVFQKIIKQISESINYYQTQSGKTIDQIILAGGSSLLPQLEQYLSLNLSKKVKLGDPLAEINPSFLSAKKREAVLFANVIGLALRAVQKKDEKGFNLVPQEEELAEESSLDQELPAKEKAKQKTKSKSLFLKIIAVSLTVFGLGALGFVLWHFVWQAPSAEEPLFGITATSSDLNGLFLEGGNDVFLSTTTDLLTTTSDDIIEQATSSPVVLIKQTPTGWLNVRKGPGTNFEQISRIYPTETYPFLAEENGWYQIELEPGENGWIFAQYGQKVD